MATELGKAYVQIIPSAKGISGAISSQLGGEAGAAGESAGLQLISGLKGVVAAAGIGAFLAESITTGAEFDKAMSQVAATMGLTMNEMADQVGTVDLAWGTFSGNLREYAQEMGANTAFSATEAADALNYMALAGYDVQTSMEMLPNVLNLAAAGSMDLALASDMVTDTQTALGLSTERTSQLVEEMAKTSSKTNTSVTQLGDAMLTIGATARNLSDGFVALENGEIIAYDGTQSLSMALGVLADNGIKGSEGGTHLRNVIMSLTSPTDKAAAAMQGLGIEVYDTEGNMRPFVSILTDFNNQMDGMTDAEKTDIISTIFNKTDIAAVNALLATSEDRWVELAQAITDADGAAQAMADTQLDNLAGDVTLFKSALEGVKITISDMVTPALREVVQLGSELMTGITNALRDGDMSGLLDVGQHIVEKLTEGIEQAPQKYLMLLQVAEGMLESIQNVLPSLLETGTQMVKGMLDGITASLPSVLDEGVKIVTNIANGILKNLPELITAAGEMISTFTKFVMENYPVILQKGAELLVNLANGIINNLPQIVSAVLKVIAQFLSTIVENLPRIIQSGIEIIGKLVAGLIQAIPQIIAAIPQIIAAIVDTFASFDWGSIGHNLMEGIKNGIVNGASMIVEAAKDAASAAFDAAKDFLGISSPAKKGIYIGEMLGAGFAEGIDDSKGEIEKAINGLNADTIDALNTTASANLAVNNAGGQGQRQIVLNMNVYGADGQPISELADLIQERIFAAIQSKELTYA